MALFTPISQLRTTLEKKKPIEYKPTSLLIETIKKFPKTLAEKTLGQVGLLPSQIKKRREKPFAPIPKTPEERRLSALAMFPGAEEKYPEVKEYKEKYYAPEIWPEPAPLKNVNKVISKYASKINTETIKTKIKPKQLMSDIYEWTVDRFNPIVKITRKAEKIVEIPIGKNPEILARRYLGIQGISESKLWWKTWQVADDGGLKITGEGLGKALKPIKKNIDDLRVLMTAQREIELASRGIKGTTIKEPVKVIQAIKTKQGANFTKLETAAKEIRDWSKRAMLDPLKEVGAISDDVYNKIIESNQFYVPYKRVMEEIERFGVIPRGTNVFQPKSIPIKRIRGSRKQIIDPFESLIADNYKITDFVERARVTKSIVGLRDLAPEMKSIIIPTGPKMVPVAQKGEKAIFRPSFFKPSPNTIMTFENGKRRFYQVPEDLAKSMESIGEAGMNTLMKILGFPAKVLRAGATLSPDFIGRNPVRDQFTAAVYSKYGFKPGVDFIKGLWNTIARKDLFWKWRASGGDHSMFVSLDRLSNRVAYRDLMGRGIKKIGIGYVRHPLEALRKLSEFGEKGTRLGEFRLGIKKGVSELEAGFASREVTLDFSRIGNKTRQVNNLIAFWNANVQGLDKLVRAHIKHPIKTTIRAIAGLTLPSIGLYLINKDRPEYRELPRWRKDLFWNIPTGNKKVPFISIPKPFELGIIYGTVPEHIMEWVYKNNPEALTTIPEALKSGAAPGWIPTIAQPIIEWQANYSFFRDRPIISQSMQNLPAELQSYGYTSETAKILGQTFKMSPAKLENAFYGYAAGLGRYGVQSLDVILEKTGIVSPPPEPTKEIGEYPFLRAFVPSRPIGPQSESVNRVYEILEEARKDYKGAKEMFMRGDAKGMEKYITESKYYIYRRGLEKIVKDFSEIRDKVEKIYESKEYTPKQKRATIDALNEIMTEIANQTLIMIESSR